MPQDYCLLVICCKTTIAGKNNKTKHVQGEDEEVSFLEKKVHELEIEDIQR